MNDGDVIGTFTDERDGQTYKTVKIGNQVWMAQNLNYKPKRGKSWYYNDDESMGEKYGRLYDWETAIVVSPAGWHLPSREEWDNLLSAVGGEEVAGKKLRAKNGWDCRDKNRNGTDDYGFSALPGGSRCADGRFILEGTFGEWWEVRLLNNGEYCSGGDYKSVSGDDSMGIVYEDYADDGDGYSVRCVADN
jgi:uncharacterized protein (TIGR02145 family)